MKDEKKTYKAIVFDCDGVLVDTERLKFEAWKEALKTITSFELEDYMPLVGGSSEAIANQIKLLKNVEFDEKILIIEKDGIYRTKQAAGVPIFNDAVLFLKDLINQKNQLNMKLALVSSAPLSEIYINLQQIGVEKTDFDAVLSGKDDLKPLYGDRDVNKPLPYIYQLCSERLGIAPENCIVFEDTHAGVISAVGAGMDVIATPNDFTRTHDFSKALSIRSFSEMNINEFVDEQSVTLQIKSELTHQNDMNISNLMIQSMGNLFDNMRNISQDPEITQQNKPANLMMNNN
jgi:beta-phosphoglucomutase